jgi:hypothetical protein
MTDARLPARWLTDNVMDSLSDRAWRTFTGSLMWSNEAATDGLLPQRSLRFFHPNGVDAQTLGELLDLGLWEKVPRKTDLRIRNWIGMGQESSSVIAQRKENNRLRQQAYRDAQSKKLAPKEEQVTGDVTRYIGQETTETEDSDSDRDRRQASDDAGGQKVKTWPTAVPGKPGRLAS